MVKEIERVDELLPVGLGYQVGGYLVGGYLVGICLMKESLSLRRVDKSWGQDPQYLGS